MGVIQRVVKPKNQRSKRALEKREPKALENNKAALFIRGTNCSEAVRACMKDLHALKKPDSDFYSQKNEIRPFEDYTKIEFFSQKHDVSLFALGNGNKKRPDNLILGRTYDNKMLDMAEFGLGKNFRAMADIPGDKVPAGTKPCLTFSGSLFENDDDMRRVKNLLADFFRGPRVPNVRLQGLEHAIQFTAVEAKDGRKVVLVRSYRVELRKSGTRLPRVELEEMGPRMDLTLRRTHFASEDLFKAACKKVKNVDKPKAVKNVTRDDFGSTLGRIHVPAQNVGTIQTRKMKGLKATAKEKKAKKKQQASAEDAEEARQANIAAVFGQ